MQEQIWHNTRTQNPPTIIWYLTEQLWIMLVLQHISVDLQTTAFWSWTGQHYTLIMQSSSKQGLYQVTVKHCTTIPINHLPQHQQTEGQIECLGCVLGVEVEVVKRFSHSWWAQLSLKEHWFTVVEETQDHSNHQQSLNYKLVELMLWKLTNYRYCVYFIGNNFNGDPSFNLVAQETFLKKIQDKEDLMFIKSKWKSLLYITIYCTCCFLLSSRFACYLYIDRSIYLAIYLSIHPSIHPLPLIRGRVAGAAA